MTLWPCGICSKNLSQLGQHPLSHTEKGCWPSHWSCWAWGSEQLPPGRSAETWPWPSHLFRLFSAPHAAKFSQATGLMNRGWSSLHDSAVHPGKGAAPQLLFCNVLLKLNLFWTNFSFTEKMQRWHSSHMFFTLLLLLLTSYSHDEFVRTRKLMLLLTKIQILFRFQ